MRKFAMYCGVAGAALLTAVPALSQEREAGRCYVTGGPEEGEEALLCYEGRVILVPGSRAQDLPVERFTGSATILTAEQLEQRQTRDIADVLRDVPGVSVGSIAGQTQVRLRGTEANHVLVLIDGIEVSDPGSGEFDFGTLQAGFGSRVEVIRGPQSALYGNDAVGGVIAYDSGSFDGAAIRLEGGTNNTINAAARWGVSSDGIDASLSAGVVTTDGEPNARPIGGNGERDIGRDSYTLSGRIAADVTDTLELRAVGRFSRTEGQSNDQDFTFGSPNFGFVIDSPGTGFENEAVNALVGARLATLRGSWTHDLSLQIADIARNTFSPAGRTSDTESDRFKISYVSAYDFGESEHSLTFAADYEQEGFNNIATFDDRKQTENIGLVGEYRYEGDRFDLSAAIRQDFNDRFRDSTTFRVGAGYDVTETTRLRAAAGSGVKNPTFFELFGFFDGRFVGNPDLEAEKSTGWEVGLDQSFADETVRLSLTYFDADLESEIFTAFPPPDFIATPGNRESESTRRGLELALAARIAPQWSLDAAYTRIDAEENGAREVRRPEDIASAALTWEAPEDRASVTLVVRYNGEAIDSDFTAGSFPAPVTELDNFTLVNLNARLRLAEGIDLFARAENLLNESYEQVFTFVSPGRQVIAGFSASF